MVCAISVLESVEKKTQNQNLCLRKLYHSGGRRPGPSGEDRIFEHEPLRATIPCEVARQRGGPIDILNPRIAGL